MADRWEKDRLLKAKLRAENPEKYRAINRESYHRRKARDPEPIRESSRRYMAKWRAANPGKSAESQRRARTADPERYRKVARESAARIRKKDPSKYRAKMAEWRNNNRERLRDYQLRHDLKKKFGITVEQYEEMLTIQNHACAICHEPETATRNGKTKRLAVDHDEVTGMVRGLLCTNCNTAIGSLKHDTERCRSAIAYLERTLGLAT